jgi:NADPH:quinone reductase-like Zn-dependent oxidoreductase
MRAIIHRSFGVPQEVLEVADVDQPTPGEGEVRVRIVLAAVHNHDLMIARGEYGMLPELPGRAGSEAVGVIDALGDGVTGIEIGQRVVAGTTGAWAEYVTMPARAVVPLDDSIPDEAGAQLIAMPFSAIALLDFLQLDEGDWMLQNAANGAVGRIVAQLAKTRGVNVIGLVRRSQAVEQLAAEGIDRVVATDDEGWRDRVTELTGGAPIRAGVDSVGGESAGDVLSLLAEGGSLVVFGAMASSTLNLSVGDILFKQATVKGFWGAKVGSYISAQRRGELMVELRERIADGTVTLPVASIHALDDIADAVRASDEAGRRGKVLLRP